MSYPRKEAYNIVSSIGLLHHLIWLCKTPPKFWKGPCEESEGLLRTYGETQASGRDVRSFRARGRSASGSALLWARRLAAVLPGLLALAIQSLAVQSHIHLGLSPLARMVVSRANESEGQPKASSTIPKGNTAPNGDSANCPLCQTAVRGGHAVLPAVVMVWAPIAASVVVIPPPNVPRLAVVSHSWRGRAPPTA